MPEFVKKMSIFLYIPQYFTQNRCNLQNLCYNSSNIRIL